MKKTKLSAYQRFRVYVRIYNNVDGWPLSSAFIRWKDIKNGMNKREFKKWNEWSKGTTCYEEGAFVHDVQRFIDGLENND